MRNFQISAEMVRRGAKSEARSGLRRAGLVLFALLIAGLFFGGVAYAFFPTGHSRLLGWAFLAASTTVMVAEMNRWVRVLPALLGLAVLNGLISIFSGHVLANPTEPISRPEALCLTLFFAACTVLAWTVGARKLSLVERLSVMAFVFSFAWLVAKQGGRAAAGRGAWGVSSSDAIVMGIGLAFLFAAWLHCRLQRR